MAVIDLIKPCVPEACEFRFDSLEVNFDKMEERENKRAEHDNIIQNAILEIQISNKLTAEVLTKLEERFNIYITSSGSKTNENWMKIFEKIVLILLGYIVGEKLL